MEGRPRQACPVCGVELLVSCLFGHVGSDRCLRVLHAARRGAHHDPVRGPRALRLACELDDELRGARAGAGRPKPAGGG